MLRKLDLLIVTGLVASLSACAPATAFPRPIPSPDSNWSISLIQSGGFAGVHLTMQVSSDGRLIAEDQRSGRHAEMPLSADTMHDLEATLTRSTLPITQPLPSVCADCFIYDLQITSAAGTTRIQTDDSNLAASGAQDLIELLCQLRDQALKSSI